MNPEGKEIFNNTTVSTAEDSRKCASAKVSSNEGSITIRPKIDCRADGRALFRSSL